jgi:methylase of polypeptide subunit release factors
MSIETFSSIIKDHVTKSHSANTHPAKLLILSSLLKEIFGIGLEELIPGIEAKLGSKLLGLRGSADLIFSNVVFEVKVNLKDEIADAEQKLMKYFQILHEREPDKKHVGIATDVIEFVAYMPVIKGGRVINLSKIGAINIAEAPAPESILWLDSFIFSKPKIRPSAMDLRWRFGPESPTYCVAIDGLTALWNEVKDERDVALKLDLWTKNMEIVYGSKPEVSAFIDHTYLVTLVKLIVYLRLSGDSLVREDRIVKALTGEYFASHGIANLIEEDFFIWILHPKIKDKALKIISDVARELLRYDLSQIDEDFFKEIYQEIIRRSERHRIGEYYTPEWLVELMLKEVMSVWDSSHREMPRILDPACGSGTFLCNAIHIIKERLSKNGRELEEVLDFILNNVVGIDINPLAVVIARANYILALGELLQLGKQIMIPVYVADSIRIPSVTKTITEGGGVSVYMFTVQAPNDKGKPKTYTIQIPENVASQKTVFSQVIESYKSAINAYRTRKDRKEALAVFERSLKAKLSESEKEVLNESLTTIMSLMDLGFDAIWVFMLSNIYAPITLSQSKFDMVVGNPPWIAMRYIENRNYQDFLKEKTLSYDLLDSDQVHLFTHMEMATTFFCSSSDLYLRDGGLIAFVMPRSVLTGALHHEKFKNFKKPMSKLLKIFDLEDVSPLFNVPSCALIAIKGEANSYPVLARRYSGRLDEKNMHLSDAIKKLMVSEYMYIPPPTPKRYSWYHDRVKEGATLVPRSLWFIDFEIHETLGIDISRPLVKTSEDILSGAKEPWRGIEMRGNVESEFIYVTLLGGDIVPFGFTRMRPVVLPIEPTSTGYELLDVNALRNRGFTHMADWLEEAQRLWEEKATSRALRDYPRVISWIDYMGKLTSQNPNKRFIVLYNASGANIVSCVVDRQSLPEFQILQATLRPRGYVVDSKSFYYETNDENEAHFICSILNSNVLNEAIKPLQPRGLFGEREIQRRPFMFPIPKFNEKDPRHLELARISKQCHDMLKSKRFTRKSAAGVRSEARKIVAKEIERIDKLVSEVLGL